MNICWLPGWASDFALWRDTILARWPKESHSFVAYPEMLAARQHLHELPPVQNADMLVAWSLGSLLAFQASPQLPSGLPLVAISPVAWFCHPELGWPSRVVQRMIARLQQDPQPVFAAFADQMGPIDTATRESWLRNAASYPKESLVEGLQILANASAAHLPQIPRHQPVHLISGELDEVVAPELALWLGREMHPQSLQLFPEMTHWPFSAKWELLTLGHAPTASARPTL